MHEQYKVRKYYIDLVFPEHKVRIEIDENGHTEKCKTKERERKEVIKNVGFKIIRINPDKEDLDNFDGISEIQDFINESCQKLTKELVEVTEKLNIAAKQL